MNHTVKEIMSEVMPQLEHLTERQRRVIESALILFSEQGYDKTSTSDIAKKAGVAEGTVYKQFKNKRRYFMLQSYLSSEIMLHR